MIICVCSFSDQGTEWEKVLKFQLPDVHWVIKPHEEKTSEWVKIQFSKRLPILFIGSVGIAVRIIAPLVKDKFLDSPVMVMDEGGRNLIPILSGHIGGANEIALKIAAKIGANPVITTSTDVHNVYSIDVFAQKNALKIMNREAIKTVAKKFISQKEIWLKVPRLFDLGDEPIPESIVFAYDDEPISCDAEIVLSEKAARQSIKVSPDTLILVPKKYCIGVGCKKGKSFEELNAFLQATLGGHDEDFLENIAAFASIDIKKDELGLINLAQYYHVNFKTFSAAKLEAQPEPEGGFTSSDFVKEVTGVSNVCERSALACAGEGARLIIKKQTANGMTLAVAERIPKITTWRTK